MEVLRRLRLPDAKSVIPKFGSGTHSKERELVPQPPEAAPANDGDDAEAASKVGEAEEAEPQRIVPRKGRGKQPIAPKPDENATILPGGPRPRASKTRNASPTSTRSRRAKGRAAKRAGQPKANGGEGTAHGAQDPPGNVQRNQSIVASQTQLSNGSPGSSASASPPRAPPASRIAKRKGAISSTHTTRKGAASAAAKPKQGPAPGALPAMKPVHAASLPPSEAPPQSSDTSRLNMEARPIGRGPAVGMPRRPTPAPYALQSPSGADAKKSSVGASSLLDAGGGIIGELDEEEEAAVEGVSAPEGDEHLIMNLETPRTRNVATVGADALSDGAELPVYPDHNSSASLDSSPVGGGKDDQGDDEASLPGPPQSLGAAGPKLTSHDRQPNPNDSTTSLGRVSTTSAAVRRRGRSHSRTRQQRSDPAVPATVSVERGGGGAVSGSPGSPSRQVTRSRSQRRQRRSRSRGSSRTRSHSADASASSPEGDSPGANTADAARLSPGGRRPQRAPPVTKRTPAQKMSMKNAIKAADLDIAAPSPSFQAATLPAAAPDSDSPSMASSTPPNGALAASPAAAVTTLAELARWKAPQHGGPSAREPHNRPASSSSSSITPPAAATVLVPPCDGGDDSAAAAAAAADAASAPTTRRSNPVRALTHGLLKRRPSFGGGGGMVRFGGTGATASPSAAGAASASASASDPVAGPDAE